uniref:Uncharacterized protein n=1 Tax=Rhizophora mucronata TaxID=61149 RepID=A0A2P2NUZ9_RHIMU
MFKLGNNTAVTQVLKSKSKKIKLQNDSF